MLTSGQSILKQTLYTANCSGLIKIAFSKQALPAILQLKELKNKNYD
ncbi:hypothetical protein [Candidatus Arsenophonus triatominarum]|nr:hypothetical protein [Candidatus Arsenophonus triatominarum]